MSTVNQATVNQDREYLVGEHPEPRPMRVSDPNLLHLGGGAVVRQSSISVRGRFVLLARPLCPAVMLELPPPVVKEIDG